MPTRGGVPQRRRAAAAAMSALVAATLLVASVTHAQASANGSVRPEAPVRQAQLTLPMQERDRGKFVRMLHERLTWLGYEITWRERIEGRLGRSTTAAVRQAQDKFFLPENGVVDQRTWDTLKTVSKEAGSLPSTCRQESKVLCIDKTAKVIRYVRNGEVVRTVDVRFGVPGLETPTGTYRVYFKWRDATSGIAGPDKPRAPMPFALFFNRDIAVHYSPTFASTGYYPGGGSHGCVNVANLQDAIYLFDEIPSGGLVHVYW